MNITRPIPRLALLCVVAGTAGTVTLTADPARAAQSGFTFSRAGAISYANQYEHARRANFPAYNDNCTNYVSQVWNIGAGVPLDGNDPYWYYQYQGSNKSFYHTNSWTVATEFRNYWFHNQNTVQYLYDYNVTASYNPAEPGDAIIYSKGDNGKSSPNFSHSGVEHHFDDNEDYEIQNTNDEIVQWNIWYYHHTASQQAGQRYWGYRIIEPKSTVEGY